MKQKNPQIIYYLKMYKEKRRQHASNKELRLLQEKWAQKMYT